MNSRELEKRLIEFAVNLIALTKSNKNNYAGIHLSKQIIRSGTSAPLNYGEAKSAESTNDFIHKMQLVLKELRESHVNLKIINGAQLNSNLELLNLLIEENNELISIFVKSIETAKRNRR